MTRPSPYAVGVGARVVAFGALCALAFELAQRGLWEVFGVVAALAVWSGVGAVRAATAPFRALSRALERAERSGEVAVPALPEGDPFDRVTAALRAHVSAVGGRSLRAESRLQQAEYLVRHAPVGIAVVGPDGEIAEANLAARRLLGGRAVRRVSDVDGPMLARALAGRTGRQRVEHFRDGRRLSIGVTATEFVRLGAPHRLVTLRDLTQDLDDRGVEVWHSLARMLTHEVMNSLAPITSLAATAQEILVEGGPRSDEERADLDTAVATVLDRARGLVTFIDSFRQVSTVPTPVRAFVPLAPVMAHVADAAAATGADVAVDVAPPDLEAYADAALVQQAVLNLVLNAHQAYGPPGGPVRVRARAVADGGIAVDVIDEGPGIPPEIQSEVLLPFYTTREGGSGIGLALCNQIARLHGGSLTITSEEGAGTRVRLEI